MEVMVKTVKSTNEPFPIGASVKLGCIIAPTLFSIYLAAMLHLTIDKLPAGVELTYRTCRKLFNICQLQAKTKVIPTSHIELQYADDVCLCAISEDLGQTIISTFTEAYESMAITLNICKMK
eukprot:g34769.t1